MMQEDITQRRVVMRGATDTCCSQWAPILPPADVSTPIANPGLFDSGDAPTQGADSNVSESPRA